MAYPSTIDTFPTNTDGVDDVLAADMNAVQVAANAIETELGTDPAGTATDVKTRLAQSLDGAGNLEFEAQTELTIATGAITITQNFHTVDTQADASTDDLDTINGGTAGFVLVIQAIAGGRTVVAKTDTGNLRLAGDFSLDNTQDTLLLVSNGTDWFEISRSNNGS